MLGRNKLKHWLNKNIPVYFKELFDVLMDYNGKGGKPLRIKPGEDGIDSGSINSEDVAYDNYVSQMAAENVKDAVDELEARIDTEEAEVDGKDVKVSANDTTSDYLLTKLQQGANITLTEVNDGGNEKIEISASGGGGGGALGKEGTIVAGDTEVIVTFTGEAGNYNRAVVSGVGVNSTQRDVQIKTAPYDDAGDLKVIVHISSIYSEDITFHVVLANE